MTDDVKVLLVEDNADLLEIIQQFLDAYGFMVVPARDGQEALELFAAENPDIVLADVLLPKVNGFQVCERIKKGKRPTPVVLMSALYKTFGLQQEARTKYGADDYLIKPLNLLSLAKRLCELLGIDKPRRRQAAASESPTAVAPTPSDEPPEPAPAPAAVKKSPRRAPAPAAPSPAEAREAPPAPPPAEEAPPPAVPPLVGALDETPIEQVIAYLHRAGRTGRLTVADGEDVRAVYFKAGAPVFANSNVPDETFGRMLVAEGTLTAPQLARAEKMAKERKVTLGKQVVESGMIEPDELTAALLREAEGRLAAVLRLQTGDYDYEDDDSWLAKIKRPEMEVLDLTYRALLARRPDAALARRYAPRAASVIVKNEARLPLVGRIQWSEEHLDAFMQIDGARTVEQVIAASGQPPTAVHQLIYTLELFDLIRFREGG